MSMPYQWPDDPEADRQWRREQAALRWDDTLSPKGSIDMWMIALAVNFGISYDETDRDPVTRGIHQSAREIFRSRRVPRLVFANTCLSSVVTPATGLTAAEMNRQLAGLAEALFERRMTNDRDWVAD